MARQERFEIPCRECGKPLIFIRTRAGKNMPCEAEPVLYWPDADGPLLSISATAHMSGGHWPDIRSTAGERLRAALGPLPRPAQEQGAAGRTKTHSA